VQGRGAHEVAGGGVDQTGHRDDDPIDVAAARSQIGHFLFEHITDVDEVRLGRLDLQSEIQGAAMDRGQRQRQALKITCAG
jgi:hypothetical protein